MARVLEAVSALMPMTYAYDALAARPPTTSADVWRSTRS
jgi:hypothetical protein